VGERFGSCVFCRSVGSLSGWEIVVGCAWAVWERGRGWILGRSRRSGRWVRCGGVVDTLKLKECR
jgi:hypothetical protein